ncbi:P-loop containing nucleoside triphosphate hydrolase protein [Schizopora paradoxa]|uniref:p-loop containing nucleoside triphosphate hydrolase protein n=1 Tax=Schizopora paradoxa TaxID=27342 RepID=A0A0H2SPG0_9AGAM|nr:P-loop containing nucleoside triphosphate hydrolase protein [Schizopora paradoxa]
MARTLDVALWPPRDILLKIIPGGLIVSLLYIFLAYILDNLRLNLQHKSPKGNRTLSYAPGARLLGNNKSPNEHILEFSDGITVLSYKILRLLAVLALVAIQSFQISNASRESFDLMLLINYVFVGILCTVGIFSDIKVRDESSHLAALLLLLDFAVYFVLDGLPFVMIDSSRFNPDTSALARTRLICLLIAGAIVPLLSPRPFRPIKVEEEPNPSDVAPLLSRLFYTFMDGVIFHAWKVPHIGIEDLPVLPSKEEAEVLGDKGLRHLDPVALKNRRHFFWSILHVFGLDYLQLIFWTMLSACARFAVPYGMKNLLSYVETGKSPYGFKPWVWIGVLAFGPVLMVFIHNQWLTVGTRTLAETNSILTQLVFEHCLRIRLNQGSSWKDIKDTKNGSSNPGPGTEGASGSSSSDTAGKDDSDADEKVNIETETRHVIGRINNLITSDLNSVGMFYVDLRLPATMLQLILSIWFLYDVLGWSAFVGILAIAISIPIPMYLSKYVTIYQKEKMSLTDKRVQGVTESLGVLRMIKLFAWEPYILDDITQRRDDELRVLRKQKIIEIFLRVFASCMPMLAKVATIGVYALVFKGEITASRIFSALMVFTMMEYQINPIVYMIPNILKLKVSYDRFDEFLFDTQTLGPDVEKDIEEHSTSEVGESEIGFNACSFSWDDFSNVGSNGPAHSKRRFELKFDSKVVFKPGCINLVTGPTGSGKTAILMALLGEMYYKAVREDSWCRLPREQGIAYAAQESWVLNDTIRNNILLDLEFDEERYKKVIQQSALERDLSLLEAGDLTEVGEKGLTLSGGQKARVTLARALYSYAQILLLDDVLAALDVHTSKWIVNQALSGELVSGRTVILVTHNVALVAPIARYMVVLGKNGQVSSMGSVEDVLKIDKELEALLEEEKLEEIKELKKEEEEPKAGTDVDAIQRSGKLVVEEEVAIGRVAWKPISLFVESFGGPLVWATYFGFEIITRLVNIYQKWLMAYWSDQYETHPASEVNAIKFILLFAAGSVLEQMFDFLADAYHVIRCVVASRVITQRLMQSMLSATFRWLDVTPVGRIIMRCTEDINAIDQSFQSSLFSFLYTTITLSSYFITSLAMAGMHAMIPGLIMVVSVTFLGHVYLRASLCMRREISKLKGPMMSQVTTTLSALPSIRAYGAQAYFREALKDKINLYTRASFALYDNNRWISVRVESLGGLFAAAVSVYFIYGSNLPAGYIGFTLSIVVNFADIVRDWVGSYNNLELQANSVERIQGYLEIDHEVAPTTKGVPPAYWPSSGRLIVENLSARYSDDAPEILHDLSFEIIAGQRVAIVGRTGAGKSTITLALLRAIKTSGKVYYDGIATDTINLDALRSNVTLIPQQPELIRGTLRENLDPFGKHEDAELNTALRAAGLYDLHLDTEVTEANASSSTSEDPFAVSGDASFKTGSHKIGLDTMVESGGTNFSLGQRQIVALARAIVRRSKLLILDEATAAIDYATDAAIQKALRTEFDKGTTLITVAHRLQTVMDYDKIMVLEDGKLVEFDSPVKLLQNEKGLLRALVEESEDREVLKKMAGLQ